MSQVSCQSETSDHWFGTKSFSFSVGIRRKEWVPKTRLSTRSCTKRKSTTEGRRRSRTSTHTKDATPSRWTDISAPKLPWPRCPTWPTLLPLKATPYQSTTNPRANQNQVLYSFIEPNTRNQLMFYQIIFQQKCPRMLLSRVSDALWPFKLRLDDLQPSKIIERQSVQR